MRMEGRRNFIELLCHRACEESARTAVMFLLDGEESCQSLTYGELDGRARGLAVQLLTEVSAGDRVLLLQPPGLEFVVSFLACFYAGVVAIPAYPPRNARHVPRIEGILQDAGANPLCA